ncbi:MAG: hypothetical protein ACRDRD_18665, partial [Pseudonocardiaceae bacterium]
SSAALREGAFLGTPAVSVGTRQHDRECGPNVMFTAQDPGDIAEAIRAQLTHGRYPRSDLFGCGTAGRDIADVLATVNPPVQKRLHYDSAALLGDRTGGSQDFLTPDAAPHGVGRAVGLDPAEA